MEHAHLQDSDSNACHSLTQRLLHATHHCQGAADVGGVGGPQQVGVEEPRRLMDLLQC